MKARSLSSAKVRAALRALPKEALLAILDRALTHVPEDRLSDVLGTSVRSEEVAEGPSAANALLKAANAFRKDSLDGDYYDSFDVNSKNWTQMSEGTEDWIAECKRLLDSCVAQAPVGPPAVVREAIEILIDLLRRIDSDEEIVFFADEAGSWQVGVEWDVVLHAYFACLSRTAEPKEYAKVVRGLVSDHAAGDKAGFLRAARKAATPEQKKALHQ